MWNCKWLLQVRQYTVTIRCKSLTRAVAIQITATTRAGSPRRTKKRKKAVSSPRCYCQEGPIIYCSDPPNYNKKPNMAHSNDISDDEDGFLSAQRINSLEVIRFVKNVLNLREQFWEIHQAVDRQAYRYSFNTFYRTIWGLGSTTIVFIKIMKIEAAVEWLFIGYHSWFPCPWVFLKSVGYMIEVHHDQRQTMKYLNECHILWNNKTFARCK